jgi:hypothetical protein
MRLRVRACARWPSALDNLVKLCESEIVDCKCTRRAGEVDRLTRSLTTGRQLEFAMSAKTFEGSVSIVRNTKGEIALKRDPEGKFSAANAAECYSTMTQLAKKHKLPVNQYCLFTPDGGTEPVLLANRYGNPYIALLPKRDGSVKRGSVTKLA